MTNANTHKVTITRALVEGVNTARRVGDELRTELMGARFGSQHYEDLERQINLMDDWSKELGAALVWLTGDELAKMRELRKAGG